MEITESGCWHSSFKTSDTGYVQLSFRGSKAFQHRLSYQMYKGSIPNGLYVLHTCDNRKCWNPDHLWLGTISDNKQDELRKGRNYEASRTHCPRGHAYEVHGVRAGKSQWRKCTLCQRAKERRRAGWPEHLLFIDPIPRGARTERRTFQHLRKHSA